MTTSTKPSRLAGLQAKAEAAAQVEELRILVRDDVLNPETSAGIRGLGGLDASPTKASNDADKMVLLYHAYDGRAVRVPMYQAEDRIGRRFERTDEVPEEFWGQQVWRIRAPRTETEQFDFQCRLSPKASAEIKAEMTAAGLRDDCRKKLKHGGFETQFEADEHFRVKHPRRWKSYRTWMTDNAARSSANQMTAAIQALVAGSSKPAE